jgi:putative flippase GtrA
MNTPPPDHHHSPLKSLLHAGPLAWLTHQLDRAVLFVLICIGMAPENARKLWRSCRVGVLASVLDQLSLAVLVGWLGYPEEYLWVNALTLAAGAVVMFFGNKYFAFEDYSPRVLLQGVLFTGVELAALGLNVLAFALIVRYLRANPYLTRALCTAAVYFGFSFPLWHFIFKKTPRPSEVSALEPLQEPAN